MVRTTKNRRVASSSGLLNTEDQDDPTEEDVDLLPVEMEPSSLTSEQRLLETTTSTSELLTHSTKVNNLKMKRRSSTDEENLPIPKKTKFNAFSTHQEMGNTASKRIRKPVNKFSSNPETHIPSAKLDSPNQMLGTTVAKVQSKKGKKCISSVEVLAQDNVSVTEETSSWLPQAGTINKGTNKKNKCRSAKQISRKKTKHVSFKEAGEIESDSQPLLRIRRYSSKLQDSVIEEPSTSSYQKNDINIGKDPSFLQKRTNSRKQKGQAVPKLCEGVLKSPFQDSSFLQKKTNKQNEQAVLDLCEGALESPVQDSGFLQKKTNKQKEQAVLELCEGALESPVQDSGFLQKRNISRKQKRQAVPEMCEGALESTVQDSSFLQKKTNKQKEQAVLELCEGALESPVQDSGFLQKRNISRKQKRQAVPEMCEGALESTVQDSSFLQKKTNKQKEQAVLELCEGALESPVQYSGFLQKRNISRKQKRQAVPELCEGALESPVQDSSFLQKKTNKQKEQAVLELCEGALESPVQDSGFLQKRNISRKQKRQAVPELCEGALESPGEDSSLLQKRTNLRKQKGQAVPELCEGALESPVEDSSFVQKRINSRKQKGQAVPELCEGALESPVEDSSFLQKRTNLRKQKGQAVPELCEGSPLSPVKRISKKKKKSVGQGFNAEETLPMESQEMESNVESESKPIMPINHNISKKRKKSDCQNFTAEETLSIRSQEIGSTLNNNTVIQTPKAIDCLQRTVRPPNPRKKTKTKCRKPGKTVSRSTCSNQVLGEQKLAAAALEDRINIYEDITDTVPSESFAPLVPEVVIPKTGIMKNITIQSKKKTAPVKKKWQNPNPPTIIKAKPKKRIPDQSTTLKEIPVRSTTDQSISSLDASDKFEGNNTNKAKKSKKISKKNKSPKNNKIIKVKLTKRKKIPSKKHNLSITTNRLSIDIANNSLIATPDIANNSLIATPDITNNSLIATPDIANSSRIAIPDNARFEKSKPVLMSPKIFYNVSTTDECSGSSLVTVSTRASTSHSWANISTSTTSKSSLVPIDGKIPTIIIPRIDERRSPRKCTLTDTTTTTSRTDISSSGEGSTSSESSENYSDVIPCAKLDLSISTDDESEEQCKVNLIECLNKIRMFDESSNFLEKLCDLGELEDEPSANVVYNNKMPANSKKLKETPKHQDISEQNRIVPFHKEKHSCTDIEKYVNTKSTPKVFNSMTQENTGCHIKIAMPSLLDTATLQHKDKPVKAVNPSCALNTTTLQHSDKPVKAVTSSCALNTTTLEHSDKPVKAVTSSRVLNTTTLQHSDKPVKPVNSSCALNTTTLQHSDKPVKVIPSTDVFNSHSVAKGLYDSTESFKKDIPKLTDFSKGLFQKKDATLYKTPQHNENHTETIPSSDVVNTATLQHSEKPVKTVPSFNLVNISPLQDNAKQSKNSLNEIAGSTYNNQQYKHSFRFDNIILTTTNEKASSREFAPKVTETSTTWTDGFSRVASRSPVGPTAVEDTDNVPVNTITDIDLPRNTLNTEFDHFDCDVLSLCAESMSSDVYEKRPKGQRQKFICEKQNADSTSLPRLPTLATPKDTCDLPPPELNSKSALNASPPRTEADNNLCDVQPLKMWQSSENAFMYKQPEYQSKLFYNICMDHISKECMNVKEECPFYHIPNKHHMDKLKQILSISTVFVVINEYLCMRDILFRYKAFFYYAKEFIFYCINKLYGRTLLEILLDIRRSAGPMHYTDVRSLSALNACTFKGNCYPLYIYQLEEGRKFVHILLEDVAKATEELAQFTKRLLLVVFDIKENVEYRTALLLIIKTCNSDNLELIEATYRYVIRNTSRNIYRETTILRKFASVLSKNAKANEYFKQFYDELVSTTADFTLEEVNEKNDSFSSEKICPPEEMSNAEASSALHCSMDWAPPFVPYKPNAPNFNGPERNYRISPDTTQRVDSMLVRPNVPRFARPAAPSLWNNRRQQGPPSMPGPSLPYFRAKERNSRWNVGPRAPFQNQQRF